MDGFLLIDLYILQYFIKNSILYNRRETQPQLPCNNNNAKVKLQIKLSEEKPFFERKRKKEELMDLHIITTTNRMSKCNLCGI